MQKQKGERVVGERFRKTIILTLYIFATLLILVGYFVPIFRLIILKEDSSQLINWMSWFSVGLSLISLILGVFSIVLSSKDQKQSKSALDKIINLQSQIKTELREVRIITNNIQYGQISIFEKAFNVLLQNFVGTKKSWAQDSTGKND